MPSYYDSKKNKPGKARVKYEKGGKVKGKEEELTASQKEALQELKYKEMDKKMQEAAENDPTTKRNMGKYAKGGKVKKMAKGGKFEVRGQGAATRGGNFSRNG